MSEPIVKMILKITPNTCMSEIPEKYFQVTLFKKFGTSLFDVNLQPKNKLH